MNAVEAIGVQHDGEHPAQPCWLTTDGGHDWPCDIQTLLREIGSLRVLLSYAMDAIEVVNDCHGCLDNAPGGVREDVDRIRGELGRVAE